MNQAATERQDALMKATSSIEAIVAECSVLALREQPALVQAVNMARGLKDLRDILTQKIVEVYFLPLQGTTLGFLTDKVYDWETVRECILEALLRGFRVIGNEFNIISGRFYGAKNGYERIVREYPGVQNLRPVLGVPALTNNGALVACSATWLLQGKEMSVHCVAPKTENDIDTRIPVKVNSGMGPDAILGKATRKLYAKVYQALTGCPNDVIDTEPLDLMPVQNLPAPAEPAKDGQRIRMGANGRRSDTQAATDHDPVTGEIIS